MDVHAKNANETINTSQYAFLSPQISNPQEKACLSIQPFGTQIHSLLSGSRQAPAQPLEVQAPCGQKQTTTSSNQQSNS